MPQTINLQQQPLGTNSIVNTVTMATTTYPFTYTTFTNTSPQPFTKPTIMPTGIFSFGPVMSCASNSVSVSASARPSAVPVDTVQGTKAGCVISNAMEDSNHAFWDLYDCCKSRNITAIGKPFPCSAQCLVGSDQTWQDLGSCLSKKNAIVVCKPDNSEIGAVNSASSKSASAASSASKAASSGAAGSGTSAGGASATGGAKSSVASGGASSVDVVHATFSKAGVFVFALVAVTSAAGMFL